MSMASNPDDEAAEAEWFRARWQLGNWLAIRPDEDIPPFIATLNRTFAHMFQIAFTPEIERRIAGGGLGEGFSLRFAQLLQPPDELPRVRLNQEVRGVFELQRDAPLPEGNVPTDADLKHAKSFDLIEEELDWGHFTTWFTGKGWGIAFDFRSGRAKALNFTACAKEFLAAARFSIEQNHAGAATDNLFSACELLSKVELMLHHNPAAKAKTHSPIASAINAWGKLGNIEPAFLALFNRLSNARGRARYEAAPDLPALRFEDVDMVASLAERLEREVATRAT